MGACFFKPQSGGLNNDHHKSGRIPKSTFFLSTSFIFSTLCYRRSTFVESPLQIHLFYAKQTQFPPILRQKRLFGRKTNPIQSQFKANQTHFYTICAENKPNQTQFQTGPAQRFRSFYFCLFTFNLLPLFPFLIEIF